MGQPGHVEPAGGMVPADAQGLDNAVHEANAIGTFTLQKTHNIQTTVR
jgi:hypothetical protein